MSTSTPASPRQGISLPSSSSVTSVHLISTESTPADGSTPSSPTPAGASASLRRTPSQLSDRSLTETRDYYGVNSKPSRDSFHRHSASNLAQVAAAQTSPGSGRPTSTIRSPSILPSASFFNPRRPGQSPSLGVSGSGDRSSWRASAALGGEGADPRRLGMNGPIVTRVVNDYSSPNERETSSTRRFSTDLDDGVSLGRPESRQSIERELRRRSVSELSAGGESDGHHSVTGGGSVPDLRLPTQHTSRDPLLEMQSRPAATPRRLSYPDPDSPAQRAKATLGSTTSRRDSTEEDISRWNSQQLEKSPIQRIDDSPDSAKIDRATQPKSTVVNIPSQPTSQQMSAPTSRPLVDQKGRKVRNWQLHEGANRFFLGGRALTSRDNPVPFILSLLIAVAMPLLFFAFSGDYLWHNLGGGGKASLFIFAWLSLIMWSSMCKTAWRDPGIVPRELDRRPERKWVDNLGGEGVGGWRAEPKYLRIKEGVVASKWCETCETYRPPRTSHCRLCDNCVDHTDHHCTFLNNCIGRRNYTPFIAFLVSAIIVALYGACFSAWHIAHKHNQAKGSGEEWATWDVIGSFIVAVLAFGLACPVIGLFGYHTRLLWTNRTTIEMLRPKADRGGGVNPATGQAVGNIYAHSSPWKNVAAMLCRPMELPSWIEPTAYAMKDLREEPGPQQPMVVKTEL